MCFVPFGLYIILKGGGTHLRVPPCCSHQTSSGLAWASNIVPGARVPNGCVCATRPPATDMHQEYLRAGRPWCRARTDEAQVSCTGGPASADIFAPTAWTAVELPTEARPWHAETAPEVQGQQLRPVRQVSCHTLKAALANMRLHK